MRAVRQVTLVVFLAACFALLPPKVEAGLGDRIFAGFLSFGRAFANATQGVVGQVNRLLNRGSGSGQAKKEDVRDIDIFASVCSEFDMDHLAPLNLSSHPFCT